MAANLILVNDFCTYHRIEHTFIVLLEEAGMVNLVTANNERYIPHEQLGQLEKIIRLHTDLQINVAGIEAVMNLLQRISQMQDEIQSLRNKLSLYTS